MNKAEPAPGMSEGRMARWSDEGLMSARRYWHSSVWSNNGSWDVLAILAVCGGNIIVRFKATYGNLKHLNLSLL